MPEKQIKYLLDTTFSSVKTQNQRIRELQDRLDATPKGGSRPEDMAPEEGGASKSKGPPVDKNGKPKAMEDWILEEPEAALDYYLEKRFGSAVNKLNELDSRVGDSDFDAVKRQFEDFEEHEEDVKAILKDSGAAKTRDNILGAYTMVVGRKALADRDRNRRAAHNSESPPPDDPGTGLKKEYNKTPLTEEVRIASGLSEEEYYEKFSPTAPLQIKLPGEK